MTKAKLFRAHLLIAIAKILGGGSLLLLGVFFFVGSWSFFPMGFSQYGLLAFDFALCLVFCIQQVS